MKSNRQAFTLAELLVVIAIIGVILALTFPAVQLAREAGRRATCVSNMRQIAFATINYQENFKVFPPGCLHSTTNAVHEVGGSSPQSVNVPCGMMGWPAFILPFIEAGETVYKDINFTQPSYADYCGVGSYGPPHPDGDGPCPALSTTSNIAASRNCPSIFRCPSVPHNSQSIKGMKDYAANGGVDFPERVSTNPKNTGVFENKAVIMGVFYRNSGISLTEIKDGASHTFLFVELSAITLPESNAMTELGANPFLFVNHGSQGFAMCYVKGDGEAIPPNTLTLSVPTRGARSFHPGGLNSVLGDCSVKFIRDTISRSIWEATFTRSQGQYAYKSTYTSASDWMQLGGGMKTAETLK